MIILAFCFVATIFAQPAFGYLDPGTGSMLTSALVGLVASIIFFLKGLYYKGMRGVFGYLGLRAKVSEGNHKLVFYSEGRQYWNTFKPVIDELVRRGERCEYLTSDEEDPGLLAASDLVSTKYIGAGSAAYTYLQFLEAEVCAMTTPGLDVLQIKRSKGVQHYVHLIHAPTDVAIYKTYAFDYYDSVFVSGDHQIRSLRKLEELRGTFAKQLIKTGCLYYDEMKARIPKIQSALEKPKGFTVLVAPTWGKNGLLHRWGKQTLLPLLDEGFHVILRPHPQSFISEPQMIHSLKSDLGHYQNLRWDDHKDGLLVMSQADVLVSDLSGIIFDFAFLFEKPVVTVKSEVVARGLEAKDLPWDPWELSVLDVVGTSIDEKGMSCLPDILKKEILKKEAGNAIRQLRDKSICNFACAAESVVNELMRLRQEVKLKTIDTEKAA